MFDLYYEKEKLAAKKLNLHVPSLPGESLPTSHLSYIASPTCQATSLP